MAEFLRKFIFTCSLVSATLLNMAAQADLKKVFTSLFVILTVASCAGTGTADKAQKAAAHYQIGVSYLNDNNIQPAFVEFQKALELNPEDRDAHNAIGLLYLLKLEDYPKAIKHFKSALAADGNFSEASNNLGFAYEKSGMSGEAIESYKRAIANPFYMNTEKAFNNLGRVLYRLKRYDDSLEAYKEALKRSSDFYLPYYGLALCYNALGRYGDAATALKKAIELDPAYKGDRDKAVPELKARKVVVKGDDEKDIEDLLEIMNY